MADLLKHVYSENFLRKISNSLTRFDPNFASKKFTKSVLNSSWENKPLKARMRHISLCLGQFLPNNYETSLQTLLDIAPQFSGLEGMIFPDFVEVHGLKKVNRKISLKALEEFTKYSSSEFAIRQFILQDQATTLRKMLSWSKSKNEHIRRLSTEGCRPRLPWAVALPIFKTDPKPILSILDNLANDPSEYVRRSVANNINDISKDHSDIALNFARKWLNKNKDTDRLIRHGLRTLIKENHTTALKLFAINHRNNVEKLKLKCDKTVSIGGILNFQVDMIVKKTGTLRINYCIYFLKKNGSLSKKVFKLSEKKYSKESYVVAKKHSFKLISTRKYHRGKHLISIVVNGKEFAINSFQLN